MKKVLFFVIFIVLVVGAVLIFDQKIFMKKEKDNNQSVLGKAEESIREPAFAGSFYPANKEELAESIDKFMLEAKPSTLDKEILALIVPHAGYDYSGGVATYGYKALQNSSNLNDIRTVILIGNSHQEYFEGASVYSGDYYRTPLGDVEIDKGLVKKIIDSNEKISFRESAHSNEHSLEVQLPFLQRIFSAQGRPASGWKIVPIIIGNQPGAVEILINSLKNLVNNETLLIISSDLSHYPNYEDAKYSDNKVIEAILTGKRENLQEIILELEEENIPNLQTCACGQQAIEVTLGVLGGSANIKLLKYSNSGDVEIGDKSRVVGYATIAFYRGDFSDNSTSLELNKAEQKELLRIAREAVESHIKTSITPDVKSDLPALQKKCGVFVTLKEHERLRGCIGIMESDLSLYKVVTEMAVAAAVNDNRFTPVTKDELKDLEYEISVLSSFEKANSWKDIIIGKHGVKIVQGLHSGVFLPQVATDNNWDLETFLTALCSQKAGLPADCWKNTETDIYIFTAQVFSEKDI